MRTFFLTSIFFVVGLLNVFAQDAITLKNGEVIKADIKEVTASEVIFTYEKETLINRYPTNQIKEIKYKSGRVQKFENLMNENTPYKFDIPEPQYVGTIYHIDENGTILNTLESQKASVKANASASVYIVGIGSAKTKSLVKGSKSSIRLPKGKVLLFAKVDNPNINPKEIFNVFELQSDKKNRFVVVGEAHTFAGSKAADIDFLPFNAYRYKNDSFIIELNIENAGEYAVTLDTSRMTFNLFGVD
ncbi:MAG: hypothetical protein Q4C98_04515 [Capnocytophaga sp.]|nr:hypothetical protein [Capnocytophaga sp.]